MARIKPPFKYHGGKFYLSKWIIEQFPSHKCYVEPFGGAASVLLNKPRSDQEVYCDLSPDIVNVMLHIRDHYDDFILKLKSIPCDEEIFYKWKNDTPELPMDRAIRTFVLHRMSRGGTGGSFSKSKRSYRGLPENVAAWETGVKNLFLVQNRLQGVEIFCQDALETIRQMDGENVVLYLDPPYLPESRLAPKVYQMEMSGDDHVQLADTLNKCKSKCLLSGYESDLYAKLYSNWTCVKKDQYLHSSHGVKKIIRQEYVWRNF